jgi:Ca2+-binding RTX toxin-like protein
MSSQFDPQVTQLYVALFGRAPDAEGLGFWSGLLERGLSVANVADAMFATQPARAYYPSGLANEQLIASFYLNVLGRPADAGGLAYWTAKLGAAGATPGSVIADMVDVVSHYDGTDPAGLLSAALFDNRAAAALFYGEHGGSIANAAGVLVGVTTDAATVLAARTFTPGPGAAGIVDGGGFGAISLSSPALDTALTHLAAGTDLLITGSQQTFDPGANHGHPLLSYQLADASGTNDVANLILGGSGTMEVGYLQFPNIERLNVIDTDTSPGTGEHRIVWLETQSAAPLAALQVLAISGNVFTSFGDPVHAQAVDASGAAAGTYINSTGGIQLSTIKGGPAADALAGWSDGSNWFTIDGGAGDDVLQAGLAQDVLTGGPGADTFVPMSGFNRGDSITITDFAPGTAQAPGDSIDVELVAALRPAAWNPVPVAGAGATLDAFLDAAASGTGISAAGHSAMHWFVFGGDTYLVVDNSDASAFVDGADQFVKLVGVHDLSAARFDPDQSSLS